MTEAWHRVDPADVPRPLPGIGRPAGADVRLPRLDRLRLPRRARRLGRRTRPPDRRGHRRRRLRPVRDGTDTAVKYGIPVKHVLLDNHSLGKIAKEQRAGDFPVWHTALHNPDWAAYARLCGATGIRVDARDQLDRAMVDLFAAAGPALLHVEQDAELL